MPSSPSTEFPLTSPNERDEIDTGNPFLTPNKSRPTVNLVNQSKPGQEQYDDAKEVMSSPAHFQEQQPRSEDQSLTQPKYQNGKKGSTDPNHTDGIPPVPALPSSISQRAGLNASNNSGSRGGNGESFRPLDRVKNLPPPPVGQVMPDFNDLSAYRRPSVSEGGGNTGSGGLVVPVEQEGSGMRRKTSVVKKIRERIK